MPAPLRFIVVNDLHYPGAQERARGDDYEFTLIRDPRKRRLARWFRNGVWQRYPTRLPERLHRLLAAVGQPDAIIVNGDLE